MRRVGCPWPEEGSQRQRRADGNYNVVTPKPGDVGDTESKRALDENIQKGQLVALPAACP